MAAYDQCDNITQLTRQGQVRAGAKLPCLQISHQITYRLGLQNAAKSGLSRVYGVKERAHHTTVDSFAPGSAGGCRLEFSTIDREVGVDVKLGL